MRDKEILIHEAASVKEALKKLSKTGHKALLVVDKENRLLGTLTDGDIRRYILKGEGLEKSIIGAYNSKPISIKKQEYSIKKAKDVLIKNKIEFIPIVAEDNKVCDFITWKEAFFDNVDLKISKRKLDMPVVIMAGGKGSRLEPFSNIFPKALIPVGDKTIIEIIMDEFKKHGIEKFFITLNYKGGMIESYFNSKKNDCKIHYVTEKDYLGTAGSLKLVEDRIDDIFIVSNCDVLVSADFDEVTSFHKNNKVSMTILSSIQHYVIPYGVIKFKDGGEVTDIVEKPEHTFTANAGVYILNKSALKFIPKNKIFDMTDLIRALLKAGKKVVTYPVNENDYVDIGQWEGYKKATEKLNILR